MAAISDLRLVLIAPHYAEYSTRLAIALSRQASVLLIVDAENYKNECSKGLDLELNAAVGVKKVTFYSKGRRNRFVSLAYIMFSTLSWWPNVVFFQEEEGSLSAWVARLVGLLFPILLTVHDPKPHIGSDTAYLKFQKKQQLRIRASANGFHVHGRYCREQLIDEIGNIRPIIATAHGVILVPLPLDYAEPEPYRVLMFGRMEAYKGLPVLADAFEQLVAADVPIRLTFAGRGVDLGLLKKRFAGTNQVEFIDRFLTPGEATREFQRACLVVLPYLEATQSGVLAAAFSNARPVIATKVGGLVEIVKDGENGMLVPVNDPIALSAALRDLLNDPSTIKVLGEGAKRTAAAILSWERIADQLLGFARTELLKEIC